MNNRMTKKIRKVTNKKIRLDLEDAIRVLQNHKFYWRLIYGVRLILKWNPVPIRIVRNSEDD